jgi:hypothetical protein
MRSIDVIIFTLKVELTIGGVESLLVVFWVTMESNCTVEFRGDVCGIVVIFVSIVAISTVTSIGAISTRRVIVGWIRVRMDLMESESNLSLMGTFKCVGNIAILSIIKVLYMEDVFLREMIKFSWWGWQLLTEVLFCPLDAILGISVLRRIKLEFYWLFRSQLYLESLFFGNDWHLISIIKTRRSKDRIRLALNHGLFTLNLSLDFCLVTS